MSKFIPLFILLLISFAKSEQLNVFAVDTTNYPTLSAKFYILDDNSQQIKNFDIEDFSVSENGIERDIIDLSCPPDPEKVPYSIAMSLDISGSMEHAEQTLNALELGKITAKKLCNLLELPPSEMALQACNDIPMIVTDFTSDKQKIFNSIDYAMVGGANDFEVHLMDEKAGLLPLAKLGKNKKMAILYTDAYYEAMETNFLQECIDYCLLNDITFYSIIYSNPSANNRGIKSSLAQLCKATGGLFIDGVYTHKIAELVAAQIQDLEPCTLTWESDYLCKSDVQELIIDIPRFGLKYTDKFYQSSRALSKLKISPGAVFFENKPLNITSDTSITVSAIGHSFNISDIILSDLAFNISPKSFSLAKGESIVLTLNFNPDKEKSYLCEINFVTDICPIRTHALAGYTDTPDSQLELKITHPNGGEDFLIGSDTIISWEGTLPSDTVKLEYSTDNGINLSVLTDKATNGNYKWQDLPYPVSDQCLIKASKGIKIPTDNDIKKEWDLCLGGRYDDFATCIIKSQYGGYLSAGAFMNENVVAGNSYFKTDGFINKITENGILEWSITYGGEDTDQLNSADETADGGYIFAGFTYSNDGDVSGNHGGSDVWVVKTNYAGDFEWQKCFGGINDDFAEKIVRTIDNGFIIVGYTESNSDDVLGNHGKSDVWVVKLDSDGNMIWQKCLGGSENDLAYDIKQMVDGSYILVGKSASDDGDITRHITGDDVWIVKLDAVGEIIWQKTYGTIGTEALYSVSVNDEGGFYVVGRSNSHGNDFEGHFGYIDIIAIKLDQNGNMIWQKCFGGKMDDTALSVKTTVDNGLIIAGTSESRNGNVTDNKGEKDFWILKLVSTGEIQWKKSFGGSDREEAYEILQTEDYGFVVAGMTRSSDGDVSEDPGIGDAWIIKLSKDSFPTYQEDNSDNWFSVSIPKVVSRDIDLGDALVGKRKDTLVSNLITNVSNWDCDILK